MTKPMLCVSIFCQCETMAICSGHYQSIQHDQSALSTTSQHGQVQ